MVLLANLENSFGARQLQGVRVIDLVTVQLFHLCFRYEAALVAESLFGEILATIVPDLLLGATLLLLLPVTYYLPIQGLLRIMYSLFRSCFFGFNFGRFLD